LLSGAELAVLLLLELPHAASNADAAIAGASSFVERSMDSLLSGGSAKAFDGHYQRPSLGGFLSPAKRQQQATPRTEP
jgi:hypothetical protein